MDSGTFNELRDLIRAELEPVRRDVSSIDRALRGPMEAPERGVVYRLGKLEDAEAKRNTDRNIVRASIIGTAAAWGLTLLAGLVNLFK